MRQYDSRHQDPINGMPASPSESIAGDAKNGTELPPIMRQWKSDIIRGAAAADEASQSIFELLDDPGQGELTRADLLAVDADELELFVDDLRDLHEQAQNAVEAIEAVIAAMDEKDPDQARHS
jgi:hypothetical protein